MRFYVFAGLVGLLVFAAACDNGDGAAGRNSLAGKQDAIAECVSLCGYALADDVDLSDGPCLSEEAITDWACDVVHDPRTDADDLDTNQCGNYQDGDVPHIVELTPDCELMQAL